MSSSFGGRLEVLIDVISLFFQIADMGLGEVFAKILESDVKDAIVID